MSRVPTGPKKNKKKKQTIYAYAEAGNKLLLIQIT